MPNPALKERAVGLRRRGLSYSEILHIIPVARSTLSQWLRGVELSEKQKQGLLLRRIRGILRKAEERKRQRLRRVEEIYREAMRDVQQVSRRELWLLGIALYWVAGSREKEDRPGRGVRFTNSNPRIIKLFLTWLREIGRIPKGDIGFDLYLHESERKNLQHLVHHWSRATGFPESCFSHVYFQKGARKGNRHRSRENSYNGLLRIRVSASSALKRQIVGWIGGVEKILLGSGVIGNTPAFGAGDSRFET